MKQVKLILATAIFMFTANTLSAQSSIEQNATTQTEQMTTQLSLTPEQKTKIHEINLGIMKKNEAIQNDANASAELKTETVKQNNIARNNMILEILNTEQKAKFNELNANSSNQRKSLNTMKVAPINKRVAQ